MTNPITENTLVFDLILKRLDGCIDLLGKVEGNTLKAAISIGDVIAEVEMLKILDRDDSE